MLTWKNNTPLFSINADLGDGLIMYFGETYYDDIIVPEFQCHILLFEHNNMWTAKTKLYPLYDDTKEPDVDMFVSELKAALKAHLDFDFNEYWSHWKKEDSHFLGVVLDSSKDTWFMRE